MTTESFICSGQKTLYSWLFSTFLFSNPTYNQITSYHSGLRKKNILFRLLQCLLNSPTSPPLCFPLLFIPSQQSGHTFKYRSDHDTSLFRIFQHFHFWVRQWHTNSLQYLKNSCIYIILFHKFRLKSTHIYYLTISLDCIWIQIIQAFCFRSHQAEILMLTGLWSHQGLGVFPYFLRLLAEPTSSLWLVVGLRAIFSFWLPCTGHSLLEVTCIPCHVTLSIDSIRTQ